MTSGLQWMCLRSRLRVNRSVGVLARLLEVEGGAEELSLRSFVDVSVIVQVAVAGAFLVLMLIRYRGQLEKRNQIIYYRL